MMPSTCGRISLDRRERSVATYSVARSTGFGAITWSVTVTGPPPPMAGPAEARALRTAAGRSEQADGGDARERAQQP